MPGAHFVAGAHSVAQIRVSTGAGRVAQPHNKAHVMKLIGNPFRMSKTSAIECTTF